MAAQASPTPRLRFTSVLQRKRGSRSSCRGVTSTSSIPFVTTTCVTVVKATVETSALPRDLACHGDQ
jgi:hypothetical protein